MVVDKFNRSNHGEIKKNAFAVVFTAEAGKAK